MLECKANIASGAFPAVGMKSSDENIWRKAERKGERKEEKEGGREGGGRNQGMEGGKGDRDGGLILAHSSKVQSIMVGCAWLQ